LLPATRRALVAFADNFYHNVYPPEHERQQQAFDFGDVEFLQNYLKQSRNLFRTKGVLPEFIFIVGMNVPADTDEGHWIEIGLMGAYSNALRTRFNGFASDGLALLRDDGWRMEAPATAAVHALAA